MIKIESKYFKFQYKKNVYRFVFFILISSGFSLVVGAFELELWELLLGISYQNEKFEYNASDYNLTQFFIGVFFILIGFFYWFNKKKIERFCEEIFVKELLVIKHQGLGEITLSNLQKKIAGKNYKRFNIYQITIDELELDRSKNYQKVIENQIQELGNNEKLKNVHEIAYFGLSRIPFTFFLGNFLANNSNVTVFDYNRFNKKWNQISYNIFHNLFGAKVNFVRNDSEVINAESEDLIITMSISYLVNENEVKKIIARPYKMINLRVEKFINGNLNVINTAKQLKNLKRQFRSLLDQISYEDKKIKKIHFFYSGPNSLAFLLGSIYSKSMHQNIFVYNYNINDKPNNSWAIDLNRKKVIYL